VSRLSRLSGRGYGRLTPEQRLAVDRLRHGHLAPAGRLDAAGRGEAKTILGWRRTGEETAAYARKLIAGGMKPAAAAVRLGVEPRYLRRLLEKVPDVEKRPRKATIHAEKVALTDDGKGAGRPPDPHPDPDRIMYDGDPFSYDLERALRRVSSR
jgi:hypothetical protein